MKNPFPKKPPKLDTYNGTGDISFVLSLVLSSAFLKPNETQSQTGILVPPKEKTRDEPASADSIMLGIALLLAYAGTMVKCGIPSESFKKSR